MSHQSPFNLPFQPSKATWLDAHTGAIRRQPNLEIVAPMKQGPGQSITPAFCVVVDSEKMLLKIRYPASHKLKLKSIFGRSRLYNEVAMLKVAYSAGLAVPSPIAFTRTSWRNLVYAHASLISWVSGYDRLREWVVKTSQSNSLGHGNGHGSIVAVEQSIAELFGQIRRVGLADSDFGAHNLMFATVTPIPDQLLWIDLERAVLATANDPNATIEMACSVLSNWWVCTSGNQLRMQALFDRIQVCSPEPQGGWPSILGPLNRSLATAIAGHFRQGRVDKEPRALTCIT